MTWLSLARRWSKNSCQLSTKCTLIYRLITSIRYQSHIHIQCTCMMKFYDCVRRHVFYIPYSSIFPSQVFKGLEHDCLKNEPVSCTTFPENVRMANQKGLFQTKQYYQIAPTAITCNKYNRNIWLVGSRSTSNIGTSSLDIGLFLNNSNFHWDACCHSI